MPYRSQAGETPCILPRLRAGSDPTEGLRWPFLDNETSLEAPRVQVTVDGVPLSDDELRRDFKSDSAAFKLAIDNMDVAAVSCHKHDAVYVYRGEYAPELLLRTTFLKQLHADVGSKKLFVAIPERGLLLAVDQVQGRRTLTKALAEVERAHTEPLTSWVLRVERGVLKGRAKAVPAPEPESLPEPERPRLRPEVALGSSTRIRPVPEPSSRGVLGKLGFLMLLGCLGVFAIGTLRGHTRRRSDITIPSPDLLDALDRSNASFDRAVDAVVVARSRSHRGLELTLSAPVGVSLPHIIARMQREIDVAHPVAMHGRFTPTQVLDQGDLARLENALERDFGIEVTLTALNP